MNEQITDSNSNDKIKVKKSTAYIFGIILLVVVAGFFMLRGGGSSTTGEVVADSNGDFQKVTIGMKGYNYYPNTVKVKAEEPVRIYLDKSVGGCYRSFNIKSLGVSKYLATPNDYVEFTPTKPGRYGFACSMGMGTGTLIVE